MFIKRIHSLSIIIVGCCVGIGIIGFLGWSNNDYQTFSYALQDCLLVFKTPIIYIVARNVFSRFDISVYKDIISKNLKIIINVFFAVTLFDFVFRVYPTVDFRFGLWSQQMFFSHPVYVGNTCITIMCLLVVFADKDVLRYAIMTSIVIFLTLRIKVLVTLILYFFMYLMFKKNIKITLGKILLVGGVALLVSYQQIVYYYFSEEEFGDTARKSLTEYGTILAQDHFPFGTGFGSFGSFASGANYSEVYYKYRLYHIYGMTPNDTRFVSDTFWPMIIGQFGFSGTALYGIMLFCMFLDIWGIRKIDKSYFMGALVMFAHLMVATTSDASLVNGYSLPYMFYIALIVNTCHIRNKKQLELEEGERQDGELDEEQIEMEAFIPVDTDVAAIEMKEAEFSEGLS